MKRIITLSIILFVFVHLSGIARDRYGNKLNVGFGIGYADYYSSESVVNLNYEFDVGNDFTLAPFITFYTYHYGYNTYRETVVPIGVKGYYYFDRLLKAGPKWDFYGAGSLGLAVIRDRSWDSGFNGNRSDYGEIYPLYLDLHIGARYYLSNKVGLFLDLSTGVSTLGLSFKL